MLTTFNFNLMIPRIIHHVHKANLMHFSVRFTMFLYSLQRDVVNNFGNNIIINDITVVECISSAFIRKEKGQLLPISVE